MPAPGPFLVQAVRGAGGGYTCRSGVAGKTRRWRVELVGGLIKAGITIAVLALIMMALAALFMIIFGIATGIDDNMTK